MAPNTAVLTFDLGRVSICNETEKYKQKFITLVHDKIDIEKYIAIMTNNSSAFVKKWAKFLTWVNFWIPSVSQ